MPRRATGTGSKRSAKSDEEPAKAPRKRSTKKRTGDPFELKKLSDPKNIMTARKKGDNNLNPCGTARTKKQQEAHRRKLADNQKKREEEREYRREYQIRQLEQ